jgi:hypothetical protein
VQHGEGAWLVRYAGSPGYAPAATDEEHIDVG